MINFKNWLENNEEAKKDDKKKEEYERCEYCNRSYPEYLVTTHRGRNICDFCRDQGE